MKLRKNRKNNQPFYDNTPPSSISKNNATLITLTIGLVIMLMAVVYLNSYSIKLNEEKTEALNAPIADTRETREIKGFIMNSDTSKITSTEVQEKDSRFGFIFVSYSPSTTTTNTEEKTVTRKFYNLYIKGKEGFTLQQIPEEWVEIVETDDVEPSIKGRFTSTGKIYSDFIEEYPYVVYVPVGTLVFDYNVDLEKDIK